MALPGKIMRKLRILPDQPGCYMMRDRRGRIIYVGKAASLRKRVQSYFRQATLRNGSPKLRGLVKSAHDIDYIVVRNEAEAILTEGRLIKDYRPRYNVSFRDDKRFLLLKGEADQRLPRLRLCRIKGDDTAVFFGPYASSSAARAAIDFAEKKFGLRKCSPRAPDRKTYRHCINDIIRYCSAPCIGKVTSEEYGKRFVEACAFLRGERREYLKELRSEMELASSKLEFERAGALRDTLLLLEKAVRRKARVASTPDMKRKEGRLGIEELRRFLRLKKMPGVIEAYDISNISGTYAVGSMVCSVGGVPQRNRYRHFRIKTVVGSDDPRMMAEVISRRFSRLIGEGGEPPSLVLVDGGIAQMRAARSELIRLGMADVAAAGLAKRFEDIYVEDNGPPIKLPRNSCALKVLQHIRDEAHRFALTYHRQLRRRRIKESVLDGVAGIGSKRKQLLLERFGSVRRLAQATEKQITEVPGVGPETAKAIKSRLVTPDIHRGHGP